MTEVDNVVKGTVEHCQTIVETDHDNHPLKKQKQNHFYVNRLQYVMSTELNGINRGCHRLLGIEAEHHQYFVPLAMSSSGKK